MSTEREKKRKSRFFTGLFFGVILGGLGALLAPHWWQSYLPEALLPEGAVEGIVLDKAREEGKLLLKLDTAEGVLLVTFTERVEEIDLLVESGDRLSLRSAAYEPFLSDPIIGRVRKPEEPVAPAPEEPAPSPVEEEPEESPETTSSTSSSPPGAR